MDDFLLASRILLSAVFLLAGITKLADLRGTVETVVEFGVLKGFASVAGYLLPVAELTVAVLLLPVVSAWWGALGSLSLLALFTTAISINLARGRQPECHCFGQLQSKPISAKTIIRNVLLMGIAIFILLQGRSNPGPGVTYWLRNLTSFEIAAILAGIVLIGFLAFQAWMLLHLFRQNGRLMLRMDALEGSMSGTPMPSSPALPAHHNGPALGSKAPTFELPNLAGKKLSLERLLKNGKPLMLIFSDPGCGPCNALLPNIADWQKTHSEKLSIALITRGTVDENQSKISEFGLDNVLLQIDREVASSYEAHGTPMAVVLNPDGTIGSSVVGGSDAITALLGDSVGIPILFPPQNAHNGNGNGHNHALPPMPPAVKIGDPAPQFELPDLDGNIVRLEDFKGKSTLLLFWNPGCGYCSQMIDELKAWQLKHTAGSPSLIVISNGSPETNRAQGLVFTTVLDQSFLVGSLYGGGGTPSGILVSEDGLIASELAIGAQAVLTLAEQKGGKFVVAVS